jgi:hypothetical protein
MAEGAKWVIEVRQAGSTVLLYQRSSAVKNLCGFAPWHLCVEEFKAWTAFVPPAAVCCGKKINA